MTGHPRIADAERGDTAVNTVVVVPSLLLVGLLLLLGGRVVLARGTVESAAQEAARSASISRSVAVAAARAESTATSTLANSGVACESTSVHVDATALQLPVGETGTVEVHVRCVVPLRDLGVPGAPGAVTLTATGRSAVDAYRER